MRSRRRSISSGRSSSRRRSPARRSRRARTRTTSGRRPASRARGSSPITDPGSELERVAGERGFRHVFQGEPTIGGRYSALSPFGIVPAALMGVDVGRLLANAVRMAEVCRKDDGNPGYELGREFGTGWQEGRDKICIEETDGGFGLWAEQLIAESTGKLGKGLVPGARRVARRPRPAGRAARDRGPVLARRRVLPLGVRGRRRGRLSRDQPVRPARRAGGEGQDERGARGRRRARRRARGIDREPARAGARSATTSACRPSSSRATRTTAASRISCGSCAAAAVSSSRTATARGTCTRPGSCTRAARTRGSSCRSSTTRARSSRSPNQPFGFRRLICAQAAGDYASLKERGRRVARVHIEEI